MELDRNLMMLLAKENISRVRKFINKMIIVAGILLFRVAGCRLRIVIVGDYEK